MKTSFDCLTTQKTVFIYSMKGNAQESWLQLAPLVSILNYLRFRPYSIFRLDNDLSKQFDQVMTSAVTAVQNVHYRQSLNKGL